MHQRIFVPPGYRVTIRYLEDGSMELTIKPPELDGNLPALAGFVTAPSGPRILRESEGSLCVLQWLPFCGLTGQPFDLN